MAYIGKEPAVGNFQVCDAISVVNGQAAYTMQVSSTNVVPESANHMLVSLNGILQKPGSSFTVSGSTITFASNLATGDVIDFIMLLGSVLNIGTPSDATVTDAKTNFTSTSSAAGLQIKGDGTTDGTLQLNCSQNSHGIKLASPAHSAGQSYTLKFPENNVTAGSALVVDSISGSGTTATGQLTFGSAGGLNLISTTTISNAASSTLDVFTSTYRNYRIIGSGITPATDGANLRIELFQADDTEASNDYWAGLILDDDGSDGGTRTQIAGTAENEFRIFSGADSGGDQSQVNFDMMVFTPQLAADTTISVQSAGRRNPTRASIQNFGGFGGSTSIMTKIKFSFSSGNIANGVISVYGLSA